MNVPEKHRAVAHAWVDGAKVEYREGVSPWLSATTPQWYPDTEYRVAVTKPSIDWSQVNPKFVALFQTSSGIGLLVPTVPSKCLSSGLFLVSFSCERARADSFTSYVAGTCDPGDSLVLRPGVQHA